MQGYNAQAVVTARQIVIAADISPEGLDTANLAPMVSTACRELQAAGVTDRPGVGVADADWKNDPIEALVAEGIQTLVAPDADRRNSCWRCRLLRGRPASTSLAPRPRHRGVGYAA